MNGAKATVALLQRMGVPFIAALCGNGLDPLLEAADAAGLPVIDTRNEQAAAYIADAYARLTGQLGVCAVSSGVAHVNALAGLTNAWYDGAPVLLISGSSPSPGLGRGTFQDMDQIGMARPVTKYAERVTQASRIPLALREAVGAACGGRPGPVHLTITLDALQGPLPPDAVERLGPLARVASSRSAADPDGLAHGLALLASARRPVIVAGSGVFYAEAGEALRRFSRQSATPVVVPIWDRGAIDTPWETYVGLVGPASGEPDILTQADLIVMLGAAVDYRVRYLDAPPLRAGVKVVRVTDDAQQMYQGITPDVAILGDSQTVLEAWRDMWSAGELAPHTGWLEEARHSAEAFYRRWVCTPESYGVNGHSAMDGGALVRAVAGVLEERDPEPVLLIDGGNIGQWAHMQLASRRYPAHWLTCGASGVVGWGVPGAMAARLAYPERPVVLISGDGSLGFGLMEFESAARQGLSFVTVVADDCAWGIVATGQERSCGRRLSSELGPADYAGVAQALGGRGMRAETPEGLQNALREALRERKPTLIQVPISVGGPA
ncbi:MAG: thiamine pyrophosphate-binding protein [Anaerolineae bacterium]|jgi:acetolactate synthase-1/2/3 large subunit|nr:thiamine pyrophosphate-binding protein [Chloroflexota bacterium]